MAKPKSPKTPPVAEPPAAEPKRLAASSLQLGPTPSAPGSRLKKR